MISEPEKEKSALNKSVPFQHLLDTPMFAPYTPKEESNSTPSSRANSRPASTEYTQLVLDVENAELVDMADPNGSWRTKKDATATATSSEHSERTEDEPLLNGDGSKNRTCCSNCSIM
jgi:hypothetical protein